MPRPKSAGDVQRANKDEDALIPEPMASPTKGILLTPGTAGAKRKTVTFGDDVMEGAETRPGKSGLPDDCPGKFPSPWVKAGAAEEHDEDSARKSAGRSKLTEALEQARDESAKRKRSDKRTRTDGDEDDTKDLAEPRSDSGSYWKAQYDSYRENSQREVRKLIAKQKMAKSFAKDKDSQCTELADQLRQEKKKSEKLEKRTAELEAQLSEMQTQLAIYQSLDEKPELRSRETKSNPVTRRLEKTEPAKAAAATAAVHSASEQPSKESWDRQQQAGSSEPGRKDTEQQKDRRQARPESIRTKTSDDIWNQSFGSSSLVQNRGADREPLSPNAGRAVTCGTTATPLKSLSINTLPNSKSARRDSAQSSPPIDRFTREPLIRQEVLPSAKLEGKRDNPAVLSAKLPQPSPEPSRDRQTSRSPTLRQSHKEPHVEDLSMPVLASSPFEPNASLSPPPVAARKSYFDREEEPTRPAGSPPAKENASPPRSVKPAQAEAVKPMAAWNAINAPAAGKRITSLTDKSGREVGLGRIEAAKARLAARGRTMT